MGRDFYPTHLHPVTDDSPPIRWASDLHPSIPISSGVGGPSSNRTPRASNSLFKVPDPPLEYPLALFKGRFDRNSLPAEMLDFKQIQNPGFHVIADGPYLFYR